MRKTYFISGISFFAVAVTLLYLAGCDQRTSIIDVSQRPLPFNHKVHLTGDDAMKCSVCHKTAAKEAHAGMPAFKMCEKCHKGLDEKKPPAKQIKSYLVDGAVEWSYITKTKSIAPDEVRFSHKTHVDARIQCETCHKGIDGATTLTSKLRVPMKECVDCHVKSRVGEKVGDYCLYCHTVIDKKWTPPNHAKNWIELHGRESRFIAKESGQSCEFCHTQASCIKCHREQAPASHTNFWRERGHGVTADADRAECKVCHTEDSCLRCHQTITPASHKGNFSGTHCLQCHFPLKQEGCFACHKNANSHNQADRLPMNNIHKTATDATCRECHFGLKMLPHPDDGGSCLICHKR